MTAPILQAAELDQRVTLEQRVTSVDALGQAVETWDAVAAVWAAAEPLMGREFFAAGQEQSSASVRFRIRYRDDVTADMRVVWRGLQHALVAPPIDVQGARQVLELMCATGVRDGR